jgi:hypothetical protein
MPYLDIVFHNVNGGSTGNTGDANSRYGYTVAFPNLVNVCQTPAGNAGTLIPATVAQKGYASLGWGDNITAASAVAGGACGLFFCESPPYPLVPGTGYHIGAWTTTNQMTTRAYANWGGSDWNPASDKNLIGYEGCDFVNGWVAVPGLTCPADTIPPVPLPIFPTELDNQQWLPPLGWKIQNEQPPYDNWFGLPQWNGRAWTALQPMGIPPAPVFSAVPDLTNMPQSFTPAGSNNYGSVFMEGLPDMSQPVDDSLQDEGWLGKSNPCSVLQCLGTGDPDLYDGYAPPGSDRYAIYFQAINRTYYSEEGIGDAISGLFIHTMEAADPGTQLVALCQDFPDSILFGSLNLDISNVVGGQLLSLASLQAAIEDSHTVLAIQQANGTFYSTYKTPDGPWEGCRDYALIPNAYVPHVELWACQNGNDAVLEANHSNHSVLMLRIHCNDLQPDLTTSDDDGPPHKKRRRDDNGDPDETEPPYKKQRLENGEQAEERPEE